MTRTVIEPQSPGPLANTLPPRNIYYIYIIYIYMYVCVCVCVCVCARNRDLTCNYLDQNAIKNRLNTSLQMSIHQILIKNTRILYKANS